MVYEKEIKAMGEDIEELHKGIMGKYEKLYECMVNEYRFGKKCKEVKKLKLEIFNLKREIRRRLKEKYNLVKK